MPSMFDKVDVSLILLCGKTTEYQLELQSYER